MNELSISTFGFSTLYTDTSYYIVLCTKLLNILYTKLIKTLNSVINFTFKGKTNICLLSITTNLTGANLLNILYLIKTKRFIIYLGCHINQRMSNIRWFTQKCQLKYSEYAKQQINFKTSTKILIGGIIKQWSLINYMKKALLELFYSHKECFIKFGNIIYYILNSLL